MTEAATLKILEARESAVLERERALDTRERQVGELEDALRAQDTSGTTKSELAAVAELQLREANGRLVVAAMRAHEMAEAAEVATAQMSHMASHDTLTGLPNRSLLTGRLSQALTLAQRHGRRVALMYLDLDHFKHINDSLGHSVGDQLLQIAARRLLENVRQSDTVCRQGGDEFLVLLSEVESVTDASSLAEELILALSDTYLIGGHEVQATVSIGISVFPDDCSDVEAMVVNADTAMYHAKRSGRNSAQLFAPYMSLRAVARQSIEEVVRHPHDR